MQHRRAWHFHRQRCRYMQKLANDFDAFKVHHAWRRSYRLLQYNPDSWHVNKQNEMLMGACVSHACAPKRRTALSASATGINSFASRHPARPVACARSCMSCKLWHWHPRTVRARPSRSGHYPRGLAAAPTKISTSSRNLMWPLMGSAGRGHGRLFAGDTRASCRSTFPWELLRPAPEREAW
eukprot:scaffold843_cov327-Prasinococcus_capsulatus_cf.AAC.19